MTMAEAMKYAKEQLGIAISEGGQEKGSKERLVEKMVAALDANENGKMDLPELMTMQERINEG